MTPEYFLTNPLTQAEFDAVRFARCIDLDGGEMVRRLSSPVEQDPETCRWVRKPKGAVLPQGWRVVGLNGSRRSAPRDPDAKPAPTPDELAIIEVVRGVGLSVEKACEKLCTPDDDRRRDPTKGGRR